MSNQSSDPDDLSYQWFNKQELLECSSNKEDVVAYLRSKKTNLWDTKIK